MTEETTKIEVVRDHASPEKISPPKDDEDVGLFSYLITYTNGVMRRVFTDENPDEVQQRWASALGRAKGQLLRFPGTELDAMVRREDVELLAEAKALGIPDAQFKEMSDDDLDAVMNVFVPVPVVVVRSDLILDIQLVSEDEDDEEDEDEDEPEAPPAPAPEPPKERVKKKRVPIGFVQ